LEVKYFYHDGRWGAAVIFGNRDLQRQAARDGRFGYDGTHGVVSRGKVELPNGQIWVVLSWVFKDPVTGRPATFLRMLASFKFDEVRFYFAEFCFKTLKDMSLNGPLLRDDMLIQF